MSIGFKVVFPSLRNIAKSLNIGVSDDSPILKEIFTMRDQKLKKILREVLHKVPTTLLHSLEGMQDLDWNQLLRLQSQDGSFLFSPSSTAFAIMQTGDGDALNYLHKIVEKFNGGDVFKYFEKSGEFFCFAGQLNQAAACMFNLYRASQVMFQGEEILENTKNFSARYLSKKHFLNQLLDKWIITKDLPTSLPRLEARFYLEQYGEKNDVWIGKTMYRMSYVNNDVYLELAKLDYNNYQAVHNKEWEEIQRWYLESKLEEFGLSKKRLMYAYFVATANIFEPERSLKRLSWAKTRTLLQTLKSYSNGVEAFGDQLNEFIKGGNNSNKWLKNERDEKILGFLLTTLDLIGFQMFRRHD
ncbi:hypothetical protein RYX36_031183 [Vicia faba]